MPWRLAAYWKANDEQTVRDVGLMPAMDALRVFFEKEADEGQVSLIVQDHCNDSAPESAF